MGFGKGEDKNIDKQYTKDKDTMVQRQRDRWGMYQVNIGGGGTWIKTRTSTNSTSWKLRSVAGEYWSDSDLSKFINLIKTKTCTNPNSWKLGSVAGEGTEE